MAEGEDFHLKLTRATFESLCKQLFQRLLEPVQDVLNQAKISKEKVDEIVLVGGSTKIPRIKALVRNFFNGKELNFTVNPDEAVAIGAAILANNISHKKDLIPFKVELTEVTS